MTERKSKQVVRRFSRANPVEYLYTNYPSTIMPIEDVNGNVADTAVFADGKGQYFTQDKDFRAIPIILNHDVPEVIVTAPQGKRNYTDNLTKALNKSLTGVPNDLFTNPNRHVELVSMEDANNNLQKQAMMKAAGYNVVNDGRWSSQDEKAWNTLTTKNKEYDATINGLQEGLSDMLSGNTTYNVDPTAPDQIQTYNPDNVNYSLTRKSQNKFIKALDGTYIPIAKAALLPPALKAPGAAIGAAFSGWVGNELVDAASKALTGRDFATNVSMHTPLTPELGEWLNPGGAYLAPRGMAAGDALQTALTGKSREFMKPLVRKYLGEPYYNNIEPSGYINNDNDRNAQIFGMFKDFMTPLFFRKNVSNPDYRPNWMKDRNNPTIFETFRNDAHRLSMGLKPHQEILADGKPHSLYIEKGNGKYDVDWDYIRHVKQNYSDADGRMAAMLPTDFPAALPYDIGTPLNGSVVANDRITMNGGYGTYTFNPNKVYVSQLPNSAGAKAPRYFSTGDVKFTDTWDVQPLIDGRSVKPKLSEWLTKMKNKDIPVLSKAAENFKNLELVDAFGGQPFTQETMLPDQYIGWFPNIETLESKFTRGSQKYKPLNIFKW